MATGKTDGPSMTRRSFLAYGATGGAVGAASLLWGPGLVGVVRPGRGLTPASRDSEKLPLFDQVIRTTCTVCPVGCGMLACLSGSRLAMVRGNPDHPVSRGRLCLRSLGAINAAADPERLRVPLRRTGPRGADRWRQITWDEALDEIAGRIKPLIERGAADSVVFASNDAACDGGLAERFFGSMGLAQRYVQPRLHWMEPDFTKADAVLNLGGRLLEGEIGPAVTDAVLDLVFRRGGTLITVDPVLTMTASKSRTWYPVRPGQEGMLALAVFRTMLAPQYRTVDIDQVLPFLAPFKAAETERALSLPRGTVADIVAVLEGARHPVVYPGLSVMASPQGLEICRAAALFDRTHKGILDPRVLDRSPILPRIPPEFPPLPEPSRSLQDVLVEGGAEVLLLSGRDPAAMAPGCEAVASRLADEGRIPFLVVHHGYPTRTARAADIVLPAAGPFETWGLVASHGALSLQRPCSVVPGEYYGLRTSQSRGRPFKELRGRATPPGQSRSYGNLLCGLATRFRERTGPFFDFPDSETYMDIVLRHGLLAEARDELYRRGFTSIPPRPAPARPAGKASPSTGIAFPKPEEEDRTSFDLVLLPAAVAHPWLLNAKWLREVHHRNPLVLNAASARALDLGNGDRVRVTSSAGSLETEVKLIQGIHPRVENSHPATLTPPWPGGGRAVRESTFSPWLRPDLRGFGT
jgi:anaerobic selenocysteine-containing dehydrogenase